MATQHSTLTGTELHEPKGVATALAGRQYRSDGAGSGAWERIQGFGQYQDSRTTVGAPTQNIATGVRSQFINDGGFLTNEVLPSDATLPLWDVVSNYHVPIAVNDTYDLRFSFTAENYAGATPYVLAELDIGGTPGVIYSSTIPLVKGGAAQACTFAFPVFTGSTYIANFGKIYLTYTGTGTCDIFKNSVLIQRQFRAT